MQQSIPELLKGSAENGAREIIHNGVEDAVEVGEAHRCVKRQVGFLEVFAFVVPYFQDPDSNARYGAREEAGDKD